VIFRCIAAPDAQFCWLSEASEEFGGTLGNSEERKVMSPARIGISTTYKTRVALEVIVRNGKKSILDG